MNSSPFCSEANAKVIRDILAFFFPKQAPAEVTPKAAALACNLFHELMVRSGSMESGATAGTAQQGFLSPALQTVTIAWRQRFRRGKGAFENLRQTIGLERRAEYLRTQASLPAEG